MPLFIIFIIFIIFTIFIYIYPKTISWANSLELKPTNPLNIITALIFVGSSAVPLLGISGLTYNLGLSGMWTALITASSGYIPILFLGKRFVKVAEEYKAYNFINLLSCRYNSSLVGLIAGIVGIMLIFILAVTQLVGIKYITDIVTNGNSNIPFFIFVFLIIILFIVVEKFTFNILNSFLGILILIISCILILYFINLGGGLDNIKNKIMNLNPQYFSPLGPETHKMSYLYILSYWIYLGFGILGVPIVSFRVVQYSPWLKTALLGGTIIIFIMTFNMAFIGFLSIPLLKDGNNFDLVLPLMIKTYINPVLGYGIFFVILLALVGTIKLHLISLSNMVNFLISKIFLFKDKEVFILRKIGIIIFLITTSYFACNYKLNSLFNMMLLVFGGFASTFTWAIIFIPFKYKFINKGAAIGSMIFGVMLFSLIYNSETYWRSLIYPAALPVVLGLIVYIVAGYLYYFFTKILFKII